METVEKLVFWLIPLVAFVLLAMYFFNPEASLFTSVKLVVEDVGKLPVIPNLDVGAEEAVHSVPAIPGEHQRAIKSLVDTINLMGRSGQLGSKNCFARYTPLPNLGKYGTSLQIKEDETGKLALFVGKGYLGRVFIEKYALPDDFVPCVVSGGEADSNFLFNFLMYGNKQEADLVYPYYRLVTPPSSEEAAFIQFDGHNRISYRFTGSSGQQGLIQQDLNDEGWLFTPDGKHICFFPTSGDSLPAQIFSDASSPYTVSLASRYAKGEITHCEVPR